MSGRVKIKIKDKKPKIDVFKVIENRFKNMNELRDLVVVAEEDLKLMKYVSKHDYSFVPKI